LCLTAKWLEFCIEGILSGQLNISICIVSIVLLRLALIIIIVNILYFVSVSLSQWVIILAILSTFCNYTIHLMTFTVQLLCVLWFDLVFLVCTRVQLEGVKILEIVWASSQWFTQELPRVERFFLMWINIVAVVYNCI